MFSPMPIVQAFVRMRIAGRNFTDEESIALMNRMKIKLLSKLLMIISMKIRKWYDL
jgi:hypothetical protein